MNNPGRPFSSQRYSRELGPAAIGLKVRNGLRLLRDKLAEFYHYKAEVVRQLPSTQRSVRENS